MKSRGFSLIEAIIVIAIISVCFTILVNLFLDHNRLYKVETAELNVTGDARVALDDIDNFIRQANRTLASYSTYSASSSTLILQIQSISSNTQLIAATYDDVVIYLTGTDLYYRVFPNAASSRPSVTKKIASNVNGLTFTYNNSDYSFVTAVSTDITIQESAGFQSRSITLSTNAYLRAY